MLTFELMCIVSLFPTTRTNRSVCCNWRVADGLGEEMEEVESGEGGDAEEEEEQDRIDVMCTIHSFDLWNKLLTNF